jgi:hypothetical protein
VGAVIAVNGDYTFAQIAAKPTTLGGYGITNGVVNTDPRLTDARDADHILTATAKPIATAADPGTGDLFVYQNNAWRPVRPASYQGGSGNQAGIASLSGLMGGVPGVITPAFSGRVLAICAGRCSNNTAGNGWQVQLRKSSSANQAHPANSDAPIGSPVGALCGVSGVGYAANQHVPFSVTGIVTGLQVGGAYWFDIIVQTVTGGTATIIETAMTLQEF